MTEIWQYSIPITIAMGGVFHFMLAQYFKEEETVRPLVWSWIGFAFILVLTSLYAVHQIALDTVTADLSTATRVAYIIFLTSTGWSFLYLLIKGVQYAAMQLSKTRWNR